MASRRAMVYAEAVQAAQRVFLDHAIDQRSPVDIVMLVEQLGIMIGFAPLKALSGAYLPGDEASGVWPSILVNEHHPHTRQRFTIGHELGHHVRHRDGALDVETELLPRRARIAEPEEYFAEAFAASLLMPRQLVDSTMARLQIDPSKIRAAEVYRLSQALRASYLATVQQLHDLHKITRAAYDVLRRFPPKRIKEELVGAARPAAKPDVWVLEGPAPGESIQVYPGDELVLQLPEAPSTSFLWHLAPAPASDLHVASEFWPVDDPEVYGGTGQRRFLLRVNQPGRTDLHLELRSEVSLAVAAAFDVHVDVSDPLSGYYVPPALVAS